MGGGDESDQTSVPDPLSLVSQAASSGQHTVLKACVSLQPHLRYDRSSREQVCRWWWWLRARKVLG